MVILVFEDDYGDILFCKKTCPLPRLISDGIKPKNKGKTQQHKVRMWDSNSVSWNPFPAHLCYFKQRVRRENKQQKQQQKSRNSIKNRYNI